MRDFATLFKGRDNAHGRYGSLTGAQPTDRGKLVSKANSVHEAVTPALFKNHLSGKERLGIIPVRADATVLWFCIDVDFYKIGKKTLAEVGGFEKIAKAINDLGLPLVMTRSKSGGAHLWCFLETAMKAEEAHKIAIAFRDKLNLATVLGINAEELNKHIDIFPKDYSPENIGSWVNLPYFGDACHCCGEQGDEDMPLQEFIKFANSRVSHPSDLVFKKKERAKAKSTKSDRPPCIDYMTEHGVEEGHRDNAVTHFGVYAKQAFPDDWEEKVREFNDEHVNPPMRGDEINKIIKSLRAKDFFYLCNAIKEIFCDKTECKKRAFGVGKGGADAVDLGIEHVEKIDGEEPIYLITIEGKTFDCSLEQLYSYAAFRKRAMGRLNRLLPNMKQPEWEDILYEHLEMMEITEAASDTQMRDRVIKSFQYWCEQCCIVDDLEAAFEANAPYYDGKTIVFNGDALLSQLDRQLRVERDTAFVYMRDWGTIMTTRKIGEREVKLWCYVQKGPLWFDPYKGKKQ